jgi:hypothetical protein
VFGRGIGGGRFGEGRKRGVFDVRVEATRHSEDEEHLEARVGGGWRDGEDEERLEAPHKGTDSAHRRSVCKHTDGADG